ncbi:MAG: glycosyltransferase family 4 protein [Acidobacteriia bacterium]|nr:glycosyltransferase family 4 protein [Terriglobia bacterium]
MIAYSAYESDNRILRYAEALAKRGDHVDVFSINKGGDPPHEVIQGVHVHRLQDRAARENTKGKYLVNILLFCFRAMRAVSLAHLRKSYDLIHVHSVPDFLVFTAWLPRLTGAKLILDIHDLLPEFYASKFGKSDDSWISAVMRLVERISILFSHHVIISNDLWKIKILARSVSEDRCSVFINYPDFSIFSPSGRTRSDSKFIIIFPGTLNHHQGVDIAIRAMSLLRDSLPEAEFHIYGEGQSKPELLALVRELGLQDRVLLRDSVPIREVAHCIENADLGVVPKRNDPFGGDAFSTKILEFMALNVPVVVADTRIDRFYFNDSVVKFFHNGDERDLADAILLLARDSSLRSQLVANARLFVNQNSWDLKKSDYFSLVDSLVLGKTA